MTSCRYTYICINLLLSFPLLSSLPCHSILLHSTPLHSIPFHSRLSYSILPYLILFVFDVCIHVCMYLVFQCWCDPLHRFDDPPNGLHPEKDKRIIAIPVVLNRVGGGIWQYTAYRDVWEGNKWHLVDRDQGCCRTACNAQGSPAAENYLAQNAALFLALLYFHSSEHDFSGWAPWDLGSSISGSGGKSWGEW